MIYEIHSSHDLQTLDPLDPSVTEVHFDDGNYFITKPVVFENRSSLRITGDGGAVISGGVQKQVEWSPAGENRYKTTLTVDGRIDGVVIDRFHYHMARYPHASENGGIYQGTAADSLAFAAKAKNAAGAYFHAMHTHLWGDVHYEITGVSDDGSLKMSGGWQNNNATGYHKEYQFVENLFEALGAFGEFYYDKTTSELYVCSQNIPSQNIVLITNPYLFAFKQCRDITLKGLRFSSSARTFMEEYDSLLMSDWCIHRGGAVFFEDSSDIKIHAVEFERLGSNALFFNNAIHNASVTSCHFHEIGASAICFVGSKSCVRYSVEHEDGNTTPLVEDITGVGPKNDDYVRDCLVEDCLIHDIGTVEKQVAGVQISVAARITVRNLSIYDCPRAAVNIGEGAFGGHVIEYNDLFNTVLETSDHGSFNGWGRDRYLGLKALDSQARKKLALSDALETTYIRFNRVRCDHGWDIDLDDGCSNYVVEGNLCLNGGIKLRDGYCRTARNNICINNSFHMHVWLKDSGDRIENNIVTSPYQPVLMPDIWGERVDSNILCLKGCVEKTHAQALSNLSSQDSHSSILDAEFSDPENGDFLVRNDEVRQLGFTQPVVSCYGVKSDSLRKRAKTCPIPNRIEQYQYTKVKTFVYKGITVKNVDTDGEMSAYATPGHTGVIILNIPAFHPLGDEGLKPGHLIMKINGLPVADFDAFFSILSDHGPMVIFTVKYLGETFDIAADCSGL